MLLHEEFVRCPDCGYGLFEERIFYQLNKTAFSESLIVKQPKGQEYCCGKCGKVLARTSNDSNYIL